MGTPAPGARDAARARPSTTVQPLRGATLTRCMYCLAAGVPRTEEHLIPRALGGRATLRDAVCEPCRRLTGRLEQATLEREFLVPKTLLALKRRRARGTGPSRMPPILLAGDAAPSVLTAATFPRLFSLPAFEPAGLLSNRDRGTAPQRIDFIDCQLKLGTPTRLLAAARQPLVDPCAYAYSIAKWAYGLAVAERGLDYPGMQPMRDLMLGRRGDPFAFVGTPSPRITAPRDRLHDHALKDHGGALKLTLALFSSAAMLPYEVIISRESPDVGKPVPDQAPTATELSKQA